jgi:GNAT superfamily N-acetyltransferase
MALPKERDGRFLRDGRLRPLPLQRVRLRTRNFRIGPHRRRGIALALKLAAIDYARRVGAPIIRTDNDSTNTGMLAINSRLGFVRQPGWICSKKGVG